MKRFLRWLAGLSIVLRCLVIALLVHIAIIFALGTIPVITAVKDLVMRGYEVKYPIEPPPLPPEDEPVPPVLPPIKQSQTSLTGGSSGLGNGGIGDKSGDRLNNLPPIGLRQVITVESQFGQVRPTEIGAVRTALANIPQTMRRRPGLMDGNDGGSGQSTGRGNGVGDGRGRGDRPGDPLDLELERAIMAALRWLAAHQETDGSWKDGPSRSASTALATLAFLGHGEMPDRGEFSGNVYNACAYLVGCLDENGFVKDKNMYAQGALTLALAEAFALTGNHALKQALEKAVAANIAAQKVEKSPLHQGGWRYTLTSTDSDTSVSGWIILSLKTAKLAGIHVPQEVFDQAADYLWRMNAQDGGFGYSSPSRSPNMTGVGAVCQQFLGNGQDPRVRKALDYLKEQKFNWQSTANWPLYGWYYITQAMFQSGGAYWEYWSRQFRPALLAAQHTDGHWDPPPQGKSDPRDPVYATALCCLMLEVYYRYAPVAQLPAGR